MMLIRLLRKSGGIINGQKSWKFLDVFEEFTNFIETVWHVQTQQ